MQKPVIDSSATPHVADRCELNLATAFVQYFGKLDGKRSRFAGFGAVLDEELCHCVVARLKSVVEWPAQSCKWLRAMKYRVVR